MVAPFTDLVGKVEQTKTIEKDCTKKKNWYWAQKTSGGV